MTAVLPRSWFRDDLLPVTERAFMTVIDGRTRRGTVGWWWIALSAVAIAVFALMPYLTASLRSLADGNERLAANYAERPRWIQAAFYVHIGFGGLALLLSPIQFAARLRARVLRLHRICGRVAIIGVWAAGGAALVLVPLSMAGATGTAGFGSLAALWVLFATATYRAIGRGDVGSHRRWAVRTFALTYAGVTLRLWIALLVPLYATVGGVTEDIAFDRVYLILPFLSWIPNLLVAEGTLRRKRRGPRPPADEPAGMGGAPNPAFVTRDGPAPAGLP